MGDIAKLQRDALFKKLRSKSENKVSRDESSQGSCFSLCRSEHSRPTTSTGSLCLPWALYPCQSSHLALVPSGRAL